MRTNRAERKAGSQPPPPPDGMGTSLAAALAQRQAQAPGQDDSSSNSNSNHTRFMADSMADEIARLKVRILTPNPRP